MPEEEKKKREQKRIRFYLVLMAAVFLSLGGRLFYLQVVNAAEFKTQSEENRIRLLPIEARRGDIQDRNGQVLATSKPVFSVTISGLNPSRQREVAEKLANVLDYPDLTAASILEKLQNQPRRYEPVEVLSLPWGPEAIAAISRVEERRQELPGVSIQEAPMRYYPQGSLASHLLGYVGKISPQELDAFGKYNYSLNDKIGKSGLERTFEVVMNGEQDIGLRGQKGTRQVEVNASNRPIRELMSIPPTPGNSLELTIDLKLQRTMEEAMDQVIAEAKKNNPKAGGGSAVLLDIKSGAILAMASEPDFNPNDFADSSYLNKMDYYFDGRLKPLFNRAIQATYAPGSTFKMVTGLAGLESGKITTQTRVFDPGRYWKPPYIPCWQAHGDVDFYRAFAVSCNTFFQFTADQAGIEEMDRVGQEFGLGRKTGLTDLEGEASGLLPGPAWKEATNKALLERRYAARRTQLEEKYAAALAGAGSEEEKARLLKEKNNEARNLEASYRAELKQEATWWPYDTFNTSIGQGYSNYTVLQLANYVATLANGGTRYKPYLVQKILSPEGKVLMEAQPKVEREVDLKPENMAEVRKGMQGATQPGGTAWSLFWDFPPQIKVGAKTGTAQTGLRGDNEQEDYHGVFVGFAPADDPQIAFAGLIEYGRHGNSSSGQVARAVFQEYFGLKKSAQNSVSNISPTE